MDGKIWLRFWHASDMEGGDYGDYGQVEISCNGGSWETIPDFFVYSNGGNVWGQGLCDLSAYAGCTVRVAFHFVSNGTGSGSGWFIDNVSIEEGALSFPSPEDFEDGFGDFSVSSGIWEVGAPTGGLAGAHSGSQCVGTVLTENYPSHADSRMISPELLLSTSPEDDRIWLRFWHASDMEGGDYGDYGQVEISCNGGSWETIPDFFVYSNGGNVWGQGLCDLSAYAGCTVRVAFHFVSNGTGSGSGWFIDNVSIREGEIPFNNPEDFDFEPPWHLWQDKATWSTNGIWEMGEPSNGPSTAHSPPHCAGTIMAADYPGHSDGSLISPEFPLPSEPVGGGIWLHFWQACDFEGGDGGDNGQVKISCDGGSWETIPNSFVYSNGGNVWGPALYDLSAYAGCTVRAAFHIVSNGTGSGSGWFIDDAGIHEGQPTFRGNPEGFESGTGGWSTRNGIWEIGVPTSGPGSAYSGDQCAATQLNGNYPSHADARLVTQRFRVNPIDDQVSTLFKYRHWFSFGDDQGAVEISVNGGAWTSTGISYAGSSGGVWTPGVPINLLAYADSMVQIAFHLNSNGTSESPGWYIDEVELTNTGLDRPTAPENLVVEYHTPSTTDPPMSHPILTWDPVSDPDLAYYAVYRGFSEDFLPMFNNRIALTTETEYVDLQGHGEYYHYKVAAVDDLWNESEIIGANLYVSLPEEDPAQPAVPRAVVLAANVPNPFNPTTSIRFGIPSAQHVKLTIYDLQGRQLLELVDEVLSEGYHTAIFKGARFTSGVYFYRLETPQRTVSRKMILLK